MKLIDTRHRTGKDEIMDDFSLKGEALDRTLKDLDRVNSLLGGTEITINGLKKLIKKDPDKKNYTILDIGCGNGSMLREIARFGKKKNLRLELIGIDANSHAVNIAARESKYYPEISYRTMDVFSEDFKEMKVDIILCTLTLHHFKDKEIMGLLDIFDQNAGVGVVINDLQRSRTAFYLFQLFCAVFIRNRIAREDGLTSILRGFRREDLRKYMKSLPKAGYHVKWKWAFRYQWIIYQNQNHSKQKNLKA